MSIEDRITKIICDFCYMENSTEDKEVIEYGIALVVESVIKYLLILIISIFLGKIRETLSFFLIFGLIRVNAGGFHCRTNLGCTVSLVMIYFISLLYDYVMVNDTIVFTIFFVCFIVCAIFSPSSTSNNPITKRSIRIRKKIITLILLGYSFLEYGFTIIGITKGAIMATYLSIIGLVLILEIQKKRNSG